MEKTGWRILGIVFMVICILETIFIVGIFNYGRIGEENEIKCSIICDEEYNTPFYYDWYDKVCYCIEDGEEIYREFMG